MQTNKTDEDLILAVRKALNMNSGIYGKPYSVTIASKLVTLAESGNIDAARLIYDILKESPKTERMV